MRHQANHLRIWGGCRHGLCSLLAILLLAGCAHKSRPTTNRAPLQSNSEAGDRAMEVQLALMEFADRFIPALAEACDYVASNAKTNEARGAAQGRKVGASYA